MLPPTDETVILPENDEEVRALRSAALRSKDPNAIMPSGKTIAEERKENDEASRAHVAKRNAAPAQRFRPERRKVTAGPASAGAGASPAETETTATERLESNAESAGQTNQRSAGADGGQQQGAGMDGESSGTAATRAAAGRERVFGQTGVKPRR